MPVMVRPNSPRRIKQYNSGEGDLKTAKRVSQTGCAAVSTLVGKSVADYL
jgi:hypothetical protein